MMKAKLTLLIVALFAGVTALNAQASQECITKGSVFVEHAKVKNYDAAYQPFMELRKECPQYSFALYQYGERILKDKIEKAPDAEKKAFVDDLAKMYQEKKTNYPSKTKEGEDISDLALTMYDNKIGTAQEQYDMFKKAYSTDAASFTNAKGLYVFFTLAVSLQEAGSIELQEVFDLYDGLSEKITEEQNNYAKRLDPILEKEGNGDKLTSAEAKTKKAAGVNLENYSKVMGGINGKLGELADCDRLVPFYESAFEEKKNDVNWVKSAAGRLVSKECKDSELFVKIVEQLNTLEPSPETSYYLGQLAEQKGDKTKALEYYLESADRQTDPAKKAKALYSIGKSYQDKGSLSNARKFYLQAVEAQPSFGVVYLKIAGMYADSANNCGNSVFEKRAVYWKAAEMAARAGQIDPSLSTTANKAAAAYRGLAPDRTMIFNENMAGKRINFSCWIGGGVTVPSL